jgi:hypothetical protein
MERPGIPDGMREAAERLFASEVTDPEREEFKQHDILRFAMENGASGPAEFLRMITMMDSEGQRVFPQSSNMVDRIWRVTQQVTAQRAMAKLYGG